MAAKGSAKVFGTDGISSRWLRLAARALSPSRGSRHLRRQGSHPIHPAIAGVAVASLVSFAALAAPAAASTTTYTATETIPVPPASNFQGSAGGDGWAVALSSTQAFNVFHHNTTLHVACHNQSDASKCWPTESETITDGSGNNFASSGQPGLSLDQTTGKLYVYATRSSDGTGGVVCIDTTQAATNPDPFCGFTALTAAGDAPLGSQYSTSRISDPMLIGNHWYAFNYVNGAGRTGAKNALLCFDLSTHAACVGQPFSVSLGTGTASLQSWPAEPPTAVIGDEFIIPINFGGVDELACFDASSQSSCVGSWPVATGVPTSGFSAPGAPFPLLDPAGKLTGLCLPTGTDPCFTLGGASVATPSGMASVITQSDPWNGPAVVLGPRVYVPNGNGDEVACFDYSTNSACASFPKTFNGGLSYLYTVNPDPQRPTCLWVNSDSGTYQIQNFDAYTGGACGQGSIRVLASQFVVNTPLCTPASYTKIQVLQPDPATYNATGSTLEFDDGDGSKITTINPNPQNLDSTGSVSLAGMGLNTATGLPQFLFTLNGVAGQPTSVEVELTWTGTYDQSCIGPNTTVGSVGPPQNLQVVPHNGSVHVTWQPPAAGADLVTGYEITATPDLNDRLPGPNAGAVVQDFNDPSKLSTDIQGLVEDCHQLYRISVAALNGTTVGLTTASSLVRPSGIVEPGKDPPYVVILVDGIDSVEPGFIDDPYKPSSDNPSGYCPESFAPSGEPNQANFFHAPNGPWSFFHKWQYGEINQNGNPIGNNPDGGPLYGGNSESLPRARANANEGNTQGVKPPGTETHSFMLDAIAAQGSIILPFSYSGSALISDHLFVYDKYTPCDSDPGPLPPTGPDGNTVSGCEILTAPHHFRELQDDAVTLASEVNAAATTWPTSKIVILAHSQGGLIAFTYWVCAHPNLHGILPKEYCGGNPPTIFTGPFPRNFVGGFSMDSPITGACGNILGVCVGPLSYPHYNNRGAIAPAALLLEGNGSRPFYYIGTFGDSPGKNGVPGYNVGAQELQHQLLFPYSNTLSSDNIDSLCHDSLNEGGCPIVKPWDHLSDCPVSDDADGDDADDSLHPGFLDPSDNFNGGDGPNLLEPWETAHFVEKYCPGNVRFFNSRLGLSY